MLPLATHINRSMTNQMKLFAARSLNSYPAIREHVFWIRIFAMKDKELTEAQISRRRMVFNNETMEKSSRSNARDGSQLPRADRKNFFARSVQISRTGSSCCCSNARSHGYATQKQVVHLFVRVPMTFAVDAPVKIS